MNVVHLASAGELGGAERVILDILAGTREADPSGALSLIVPRAGAVQERAARLGVNVVVLPWTSDIGRVGDAMVTGRTMLPALWRVARSLPDALRYLFRLRQALRAARPALVHAHGFKMLLFGAWARPRDVPLIMHLHDYVGSRPLMARLLRIPLPGQVVGAAISMSIAEDARPILGSRVPVRVIYNGIDLTAWTPNTFPGDLEALSGITPAPPDTIRIGLVATMARWKGHEVFLRAFAALPRDLAVRAFIIGGPIYDTDDSQYSIDELRSIAYALGVADRVGFTGFVADPAAAMRALDICVHASTRPEPFGRAIVEGMALERAVIVSSAGGAAELVVADETALVFPPGDATALADRMARLAGDAALRRTLGTAARSATEARFGRAGMIASLLDLYRTVGAGP